MSIKLAGICYPEALSAAIKMVSKLEIVNGLDQNFSIKKIGAFAETNARRWLR